METLLTSGEFARLARTTKRTVHWYDQEGILKPLEQNSTNGYRFYKPSQIIDFQVILLLRKFGFSLEEIKGYLKKTKNLGDLFKLKRAVIEKEIESLERSLKDITAYYDNLRSNNTLVQPIIKDIKSFEIYYLYKEGPYAKIKDYGLELQSYFATLPPVSTYLTIFLERDYKPRKAKMKIGILAKSGMKIKDEYKSTILKEIISGYKALTVKHIGSGVLLSLLWQELEKYRRANAYEFDKKLPFADLELYFLVKPNGFDDQDNHLFELQLPIQ